MSVCVHTYLFFPGKRQKQKPPNSFPTSKNVTDTFKSQRKIALDFEKHTVTQP